MNALLVYAIVNAIPKVKRRRKKLEEYVGLTVLMSSMFRVVSTEMGGVLRYIKKLKKRSALKTPIVELEGALARSAD